MARTRWSSGSASNSARVRRRGCSSPLAGMSTRSKAAISAALALQDRLLAPLALGHRLQEAALLGRRLPLLETAIAGERQQQAAAGDPEQLRPRKTAHE